MGARVYVRLDKDDEVLSELKETCRKLHIAAATFQGIGACGEVEVATYLPEKQEFLSHVRTGMLEMISLTGNIVTGKDGQMAEHAHAIFSQFDEATGRMEYLGGHLRRAVVVYTAEMVLDPVAGVIGQQYDVKVGIDVWNLEG